MKLSMAVGILVSSSSSLPSALSSSLPSALSNSLPMGSSTSDESPHDPSFPWWLPSPQELQRRRRDRRRHWHRPADANDDSMPRSSLPRHLPSGVVVSHPDNNQHKDSIPTSMATMWSAWTAKSPPRRDRRRLSRPGRTSSGAIQKPPPPQDHHHHHQGANTLHSLLSTNRRGVSMSSESSKETTNVGRILCDPTSSDPDIGILSCGEDRRRDQDRLHDDNRPIDNDNDNNNNNNNTTATMWCRPDSASTLGGVCIPVPTAHSPSPSSWSSSSSSSSSTHDILDVCNPWSLDPKIGFLSCGTGRYCQPTTTSSSSSSSSVGSGTCQPTHPLRSMDEPDGRTNMRANRQRRLANGTTTTTNTTNEYEAAYCKICPNGYVSNIQLEGSILGMIAWVPLDSLLIYACLFWVTPVCLC
jgi:hypothetical protein